MQFPQSLIWEGSGWKGRLGCYSSLVLPETSTTMGNEHDGSICGTAEGSAAALHK